jgi:hypothetical protein
VSTGPKPRSWQESAERRLAGGLAITRDGETVLHGDAIGLQELYTRRVDDAVYFALRIDPLLEIGEGPLHVDMTAWASILVFSAPMMDATPFAEIRRHSPATAWCARRGEITTLRFQPSWQAAEPDGGISPERMVDILASCTPRRRFRRTAITLSGGWDSRLIAVLARRSRASRLSGWTVDPDFGSTVEIDVAVGVAKALKLRHQVVDSPREAWLEHHAEARRRLQYQSWQHTWMMPLVQELKRHSTPVLTGFLGDVLFRAQIEPFKDVEHARSLAEVKDIVRRRVTSSVLRSPEMFAPGVADIVTDLSRSAWDSVIDSVDQHPALLTLVRVHQNMRTVAPAFHWLFAPETDVLLPMAHPDVISASLRIRHEDRAENVYYKQMLRYADATIADMRSTNDPSDPAPPGPRRQTSPAALAAMADAIVGRDDVAAMLGPELRPSLADLDELSRRSQRTQSLQTLQWASMFAQWLEAYRRYLPSDPVPAISTR